MRFRQLAIRLRRLKPQGVNWKYAAGEIVLIVVGILVAFALEAWWQDRTDADRRDAYLVRLHGDLVETESQMERNLGYTRHFENASRKLSGAFFSSTPPPADSVFQWLMVSRWYSDPLPLLATARALADADALYLVKDTGVQAAIVGVVEEGSYNSDQLHMWVDKFLDRVESMDRFAPPELVASYLDPATVNFGTPSDSLARSYFTDWKPDGPIRRPYELDVTRLLDDAGFYGSVSQVANAHFNMRLYQEAQLDAARYLRAWVEFALPDTPAE